MAENKSNEAEAKSNGWVNFSIPADCVTGKGQKTDPVNTVVDKETGEERARVSAWNTVTLPKGFTIDGKDVGGMTFTVSVNPGKELADDKFNEGWKRVGLREDSALRLRSHDENGKVIGIQEIPAAEFAQAAQTGFGPKPSDVTFLNFSKKCVDGPITDKETGKDVYVARILPNTIVDGMDLGGYRLNIPVDINEKTQRNNVFEKKNSIGFMKRANEKLDLFLVNKETGAIEHLPKEITAGAVKEACDKSYEAFKASRTEAAEKDREQKTARDAPKAQRVASQKKEAPKAAAPSKTQAKS